MNLKDLLHDLLIRHRGLGLSPELSESLQTLANLEGLPPEAVAERLIEGALDQREMADAVRARWECLTPREQQITALVCQEARTTRSPGSSSPATVKILRNVLMTQPAQRSALRRYLRVRFLLPRIVD
jgi:hypothetical protein